MRAILGKDKNLYNCTAFLVSKSIVLSLFSIIVDGKSDALWVASTKCDPEKGKIGHYSVFDGTTTSTRGEYQREGPQLESPWRLAATVLYLFI